MPRNAFVHAVYNQVIGSLALILLLPLLAVIALSLLLTQGSSIFYRGARMGKDGRVFHIYKFRTLDFSAAKLLTKDKTLPPDSGIETRLGGVLRANRLDELPQILNIVRGDMTICGPRPVRREIAEIERRRIPGYDQRFRVKPGLIGPTQAYVSHGTSKRIRARLNHLYCSRPVSYVAEFRLMAEVTGAIAARVARDVLKSFGPKLSDAGGSAAPQWPRPADMWIRIEGTETLLRVLNLGNRTIKIQNLPVCVGQREALLHIVLRNGGVRKARVLLAASENPGLASYTALTETGEFVIERYGLGLVVVMPPLRHLREPQGRWAAIFGRAEARALCGTHPLGAEVSGSAAGGRFRSSCLRLGVP